jgi:hypothetical protein
VRKLSSLAEQLQGAGQVSEDLRACIAGALLAAYEAGHTSCKESFAADAKAQVESILAQSRRHVLAALDKVAELAALRR